MAKEIVTLYIDDTSLRLLITKDKKIEHCVDSPLQPGLVRNGMVVNEAEVVAKIQQLFQGHEKSKRKVILGVSGFGCISRLMVFPMLPKEMLDEAVKREAKRVLPLPLEQVYLSWQPIPAPEGKVQVFLIAIPCQMFDVLFKVLHQTGLNIHSVDLKPLILSRVLGAARGVIIDIQATEFDIVVVAEGVPQSLRTIAFASQELSWQEKMTAVRSELDRTIAFFNSTSPNKPLTPSVPIFASGDLVDNPESCQALWQKSGHPVLPLPLSLPVEYPEGFDTKRYTVNFSLALHKLYFRKGDGASVVNLNALPARYQSKKGNISLVNILATPSAIVLAGLVAILAMLIQGYSDIAPVRASLNAIEQLYEQGLSQKEELTNDITELEQQNAEAEASFSKLATALGSLEKQNTGINRGLEVTMSALDPTISLTTIRYVADTLNISGHAPTDIKLLIYLYELNYSGMFSEITISNMSRTEDGGCDFTLVGSPETQSIWSSAIEAIVYSVPTNVSLTSVNHADGELTINGRAPDEDKVLLYLYNLETSGEFVEVISTNATRIDDGEMDFSIVLRTGE